LGVATTVPLLPNESTGKKRYSPEQKDEFFAVLARVGSVTAAAAKLGLNRAACYH
jgi:IS30 family transposase